MQNRTAIQLTFVILGHLLDISGFPGIGWSVKAQCGHHSSLDVLCRIADVLAVRFLLLEDELDDIIHKRQQSDEPVAELGVVLRITDRASYQGERP